MQVTLAPLNTRVAVRPSDDPYKKYWWLILAGFGVTGLWLWVPMMESSVGSTRVGVSAPVEGLPVGEASLDGADNPNGAPGSTLDLAMDIAARPRKGDGALTSSLYQAPEEPALPAPTAGAAAPGGTLADALTKAASADASGWGGQKAQKGFTAPKLTGASAPGLGGGSAGSAPSFSAGGAFGAQNSQVGFAQTRGLSGGASELPQAKNAKGALVKAAAQAVKAANLKSGDGQVGGLSSVFDGRAQKAGSAIGGESAAALGAGGVYDSLDAAPTNLKVNDPNLDKNEFKAPPAAVANSDDNRTQELKQQIAMMMVTAVVGGLIPGTAGTVVSSMMPMLMMMNQTSRGSGTSIGK